MDHSMVAALRLLYSDPEFWGEDDGTSVFVHGLMVDRAYAGLGIGEQLLSWAEHQGRHEGRRYLRLDCAAHNPSLRRHYESLGFVVVGTKQLAENHYDVVLMERPITP